MPTLLLSAPIFRAASLHSFQQRLFDGREHKFDKDGGFRFVVGTIDGLIVFVLPVVDHGLHREPGEHRLPLSQEQSMP